MMLSLPRRCCPLMISTAADALHSIALSHLILPSLRKRFFRDDRPPFGHLLRRKLSWSPGSRQDPKRSKDENRRMAMMATVGAFLFVTPYVIDISVAVGPSMRPQLKGHGEVVLCDRFSHRLNERLLQRGKVIIAKSPEPGEGRICKRIVAVAGDHVQVTYRDGHRTTLTIPKGTVWLQGDNAAQSYDSRNYGPVPISNVFGRVICQIWPIDANWGRLRSYDVNHSNHEKDDPRVEITYDMEK